MRRLLAGLLALVAAGLAVLGLLAWSSLPRTTGRIAVTGIEAPVAIVRDGWGVPHIRAGSAGDAYFAVGFAHAQDRLWQMEITGASPKAGWRRSSGSGRCRSTG